MRTKAGQEYEAMLGKKKPERDAEVQEAGNTRQDREENALNYTSEWITERRRKRMRTRRKERMMVESMAR